MQMSHELHAISHLWTKCSKVQFPVENKIGESEQNTVFTSGLML